MPSDKGSWGGSRPGAGNPEFKPKWKSGKTTVIRVPEAIADEVLIVARQIDEGEPVTLSSGKTEAGDSTAQHENVTQLKELYQKIGELEAGLFKAYRELERVTQERDKYFEEISEIKLELENLKSERAPQSSNELAEAKTKIETLEKESRDLRYRCSDLERENARLERLGTDYSHASFQTLSAKYQKALNKAKDWEEAAGSYRRQAEAIAKKKEEAEARLEELEEGGVTQSSIDAAALLNCLKDYLVADKKGKTKLSLSRLETILEELDDSRS